MNRPKRSTVGAKMDRLVCKWYERTDPMGEPWTPKCLTRSGYNGVVKRLTESVEQLQAVLTALKDPFAPGAVAVLKQAYAIVTDDAYEEEGLDACLHALGTMADAIEADADPSLYEAEKRRAADPFRFTREVQP